MSNIIDRRKNGNNQSVTNRNRFIKRTRDAIKKQVDNIIQNKDIKGVTDKGSADTITIPKKDIKEYNFTHGKGGNRDYVFPGNKDRIVGDKIKKPQQGQGGQGTEGSPDGESEDSFTFTINQKEFLEFFFDDLELPDLVKTQLADIDAYKIKRNGFTTVGNPTNLNVIRSMRNSIGRRIALQSPYDEEIAELEEQQKKTKSKKKKDEIQLLIDDLELQKAAVPFIDDIDLKFNSFEKKPDPSTKAVMFCVMDVSASMGEYEKTLAKKFFMLLYLFLNTKYEKVEIVFIRHHTTARECDEQEFFSATDSGGTMVSAGLKLMAEIIQERYSTNNWNIYGSQVSDGDIWSGDGDAVTEQLSNHIIPYCQFFSYVQVAHEGRASMQGELWHIMYKQHLADKKRMQASHLEKPTDIYPVFRKLFERSK